MYVLAIKVGVRRMRTTANLTSFDLPIKGMDCASCATHIQDAVAKLPGVAAVRVSLAAERATITFDAERVTPATIKVAIGGAGYRVPEPVSDTTSTPDTHLRSVSQVISWGLIASVALVVLVATIGEQLGVFDRLLERLPWWIAPTAIVIGGLPVFRGVVQAIRRAEITSHTLMTVGVIAAIGIGQWTTAALIVFFMRFGEWLEQLTTERNRQALKQLVSLRPAIAHVLRNGSEVEVPVAQVGVGEIVIIRPGERIPVDGQIVDGHAPVDQAPITGESVPVDKLPGDEVFAATTVQAGFLKVQVTRPSHDTTFAHIVRLVEEAETQKTPVQRFADRFSSYYLPLVLAISVGTYFVTGQLINAVAVLVVACACAITIATPVVVLASVATAARRGLLIKGGIALEQMARVDTVVMDKTGTLTIGKPQLTDIVLVDGWVESSFLQAVATVEQRSEHPLAQAIVHAAAERGISPLEPDTFTPLPGRGLVATVKGQEWAIGNRHLLVERGVFLHAQDEQRANELENAGKTTFFVVRNGILAGLIAVADTIRPEVKLALNGLRQLGIRRFMLLTGDNKRVAAAIAHELGIDYQAELLPEDKIAAVKALQDQGAVVMMIGDGINDAPALVQANIGVAMGTGTHVALEAADVALLRNDWTMVPEAVQISRRATQTIRQNLGFTAFYNIIGLTLAAVGFLPPIWAAAAQSLPDVAIMLNSARLLKQAHGKHHPQPLGNLDEQSHLPPSAIRGNAK